MQGLYIHIPFCKSRCIYCDFYSTTHSTDLQTAYVEALRGEIGSRHDYLATNRLDSVYIGGGTPSTLSHDVLRSIFNIIGGHFCLPADAEVTIEVNPNDLTPEFANLLATLPVNRVSMGVQTFCDDQLRFLHRRHTASQVAEAIGRLRSVGIDNISIDLIYGLPSQTLALWQYDIDCAFSLPVTHLSAYALMYEEGTPLYTMRQQGIVSEADDGLSLQMYQALMQRAKAEGFVHYEISNFAKPHLEARHNTGYWTDMRYLGLGPGAHSYNGRSRQANRPDLVKYIQSHGQTMNEDISETEVLTPQMRQEEMLLTALRTARGLDLSAFSARFGISALNRLLSRAQQFIDRRQLIVLPYQPQSFYSIANPKSHTDSTDCTQTLALTTDGIFLSDHIIASLFD